MSEEEKAKEEKKDKEVHKSTEKGKKKKTPKEEPKTKEVHKKEEIKEITGKMKENGTERKEEKPGKKEMHKRKHKENPNHEMDLDIQSKKTKLVEIEKYLNAGAHIGTRFKSGDMKRYIYKVRKDGLNVLDVQVIDNKLAAAAAMIAKVQPEKVIVVSRKSYGQTPVKVFSEVTKANSITGRFVPGTFTNPESTRFVEPAIVLVADPEYDFQAIEEATAARVPVIGMVSTNSSLKNIDLAIPINNKGRKSLALAFWILAKEILKARNEIKDESEFSRSTEDFEYKMKEGEDDDRRGSDRGNRQNRFGAGRFNRGGNRFSSGGGFSRNQRSRGSPRGRR